MTFPLRRLAAIAALASCSFANAQQSPAVPDPASIVIPDTTCEQPPKRPPLGATTSKDLDRFNKQVKAYLDCSQAYAKNMEAVSKQYQAIAQKYIDAGNKVINTVNDYVAEVKKNTDADD
jgi:hypothetical protein